MAKTERSGHTTTDHDFIRRWVEERGGWPARVKGTGGSSDAGLIRVDFPGFSGEGTLEKIDWEEWFQSFDENKLAFLHRDMDHGGGDLDRFNKLVARSGSDDTEKEPRRGRSAVASSARSRGGSSTTRKSATKSASSRSTTTAETSSNGGTRSRATRSSGGSSSKSTGGTASKSTGGAASKSGGSRAARSSSGGSKKTSETSGSARSGGSRSSSAASAPKRSNGAARKEESESNTGVKELRELLLHELGDLLFAERVFLQGTRTMAREAQDPQIKTRLEAHVTETEGHIERLREAFTAIGEKAKPEECPAALGLKEEHDSFKSEEKPSKQLLSAFDLGSGLRVEHYEIAAYRTTIAVANALGERACADILKENLKEEMAMAAFLEKNAPLALKKIALDGKAGGVLGKVRKAVGV